MLGVKWLMEKEKQFANPGTNNSSNQLDAIIV